MALFRKDDARAGPVPVGSNDDVGPVPSVGRHPVPFPVCPLFHFFLSYTGSDATVTRGTARRGWGRTRRRGC